MTNQDARRDYPDGDAIPSGQRTTPQPDARREAVSEVKIYKHAPRLADMVMGQPAPMPPGEYVIATDYRALADRLANLEWRINESADYTLKQKGAIDDLTEQLTNAQAAITRLESDVWKAHVPVTSTQHDPSKGLLHGYCERCRAEWPCQYSPELKRETAG